jgi:uncharacterized protein (TIGR00106 family)
MALMQITIIPLGTDSPSVGEHVAGVQTLLEAKQVDYELCDMGTVIHGEPGELLQLAAEIHEYPFSHGVERVVTNIVLDDRRDIQRGLGEKRAAVLQRLKG